MSDFSKDFPIYLFQKMFIFFTHGKEFENIILQPTYVGTCKKGFKIYYRTIKIIFPIIFYLIFKLNNEAKKTSLSFFFCTFCYKCKKE